MLKLHDEEFAKINCLECALCCKSISPAIYRSDIKRMAAFLKLSVPQVIDTYLTEDNDGEFVFRQTPCPFLGDDNYCSIYESRPKACREYPHTNRKRFYQILSLTAKNAKVCPAVFNIVEKLRGHI
ncbi:MAG: YkgJ family cysteine cluster protein [Bacteroidales bacterium]|nr:YkgJ family cysteine cluster protein [Bacteroidales bacterium]